MRSQSTHKDSIDHFSSTRNAEQTKSLSKYHPDVMLSKLKTLLKPIDIFFTYCIILPSFLAPVSRLYIFSQVTNKNGHSQQWTITDGDYLRLLRSIAYHFSAT